MTLAEIPSLYPAEIEAQTPPSRGEHGYFKRGDNGWVTTHGCWPTARQDMEFKGNEFLPGYGTFTMDLPGSKSTKDVNGRFFSVVSEPWRLIFQRGGAKEFPVEQVIAFRWHIRPPYREARFPQLEGLKIYDFFCPECELGVFSSVDEQSAVDMLRQHLTCAKDATHTYRPEDLRALGLEYQIDFFAPRRGMRRVIREEAVVEEPTQALDLTPADGFLCPDCDFVAKNGFGLQAHRRKHSAGVLTPG